MPSVKTEPQIVDSEDQSLARSLALERTWESGRYPPLSLVPRLDSALQSLTHLHRQIADGRIDERQISAPARWLYGKLQVSAESRAPAST